MTLQASGAIGLGHINTELGLSATANIGMNSSNVRGLAGVSSGAISLSNFYGKSNGLSSALWAWGTNQYGALGLGDQVDRSSPVQVGTLTNWRQICTDAYSLGAVKSDGTLWTAGYNAYGQLGNNNTSNSSSPIQVGTLTNWKSIAANQFFMVAVKTDGTLWAWGYNSGGQLGQGDITNRSSPIQVGTLTNWKSVSCGFAFVAAVKTDGTLWTWGSNAQGQLGQGDTNFRSTPIQVGTLTNWSKVSCGLSCVSAIKTDGTMWSWGANGSYQLGIGGGSNADQSSPIQVGSLTTWKEVYGGYTSTGAIKTDNTLWTWGYNGSGELGLGDTNYHSTPTQVGVSTWSSMCFAKNAVVAIKSDGSLWRWGNSNQFGGGIAVSSPVQVGTLTTWKALSNSGGNTSGFIQNTFFGLI